MDIAMIVLIVVAIAVPAYVAGSVLSYLAQWWCTREKPRPIFKKMFWG